MDIVIRNVPITSEKYGEYTVETVVTANGGHLTAWIETTINRYKKSGENLVVGLDTEWRLVKEADGHQKVALIQLCVEERCVLFQVYNADIIPQALHDFFRCPTNLFVGKEVRNDAAKLRQDYGLDVLRWRDVGEAAAAKYGEKQLKYRGLKTLADQYLGVEMEKSKRIALSRWDRARLSFEQIEYACFDAFVSYKLGAVLIDAP